MMRIAYICADMGVPVFGRKGSSIHVQEIIRAFIRQGARVELFATRFDGGRPAGFDGVVIHRLPAPPKNSDGAARERAALEANRTLMDLLKREGSFDIVYERYSLWSYAGMEYARDIGMTGVLEVNAPLIEEQAQHRNLMDRMRAEQVAERVFGAAGILIAVSREIAAYLKHYPVVGKHVHIVPNGVNPDRFPVGTESSYPARPGIFTIGFVGTLKPWHGLTLLVEAYEQVHRNNVDTRLLIVGDGPQRSNLVADLSTRGLVKTAHLTGAVDPDEVPGLLASMDAAVAPYPQRPNFYFSPLKIYEYMAAGLPVVTSRMGQVAELIQDEVNGLLCDPDDPVVFAHALDRLRRDPGLRTDLGQAARTTVRRDHTWETVARHILFLAGTEIDIHYNGGEVNGTS